MPRLARISSACASACSSSARQRGHPIRRPRLERDRPRSSSRSPRRRSHTRRTNEPRSTPSSARFVQRSRHGSLPQPSTGVTVSSRTGSPSRCRPSRSTCLRGLPGVRDVYESVPYEPQLDRSPAQIGAPTVWGANLATSGQGMKIGIIDTGVDPNHPFFDPDGYTMPPGFPKGQRQYTTAKVIVARAFPPPGVACAACRSTPVTARTSRASQPATARHQPREAASYRALRPRVPRELQGVSDGSLANSPAILAADRGRGRRRHGRDQLLRRPAGDRAEPRHHRERRWTRRRRQASYP